jgi:hypothetical protein
LLITAISGFVYWEIEGRDRLLTEDVLIAKKDIEKNSIVTSDMFTTAGSREENMISGALGPEDLAVIEGSRSGQFIPANAQITDKFFYEDEFFIAEDESVFVIRPEWISMMSSSIRRGDRVRLFSRDGMQVIGCYRVAFVKDNTYREVKDAYASPADESMPDHANGNRQVSEGTGHHAAEEPLQTAGKDILERTDATSVAEHFEIIATIEQYRDILARVSGETGEKIMVVQE